MHAHTGKKVYVTLFLVFIHLPFLLCVHIVFKQNFCSVILYPFTEILVLYDFFAICICDVIHVEQKCYACCKKWYTNKLLNLLSIFSEQPKLCRCWMLFLWNVLQLWRRFKFAPGDHLTIQWYTVFCGNWSGNNVPFLRHFACSLKR